MTALSIPAAFETAFYGVGVAVATCRSAATNSLEMLFHAARSAENSFFAARAPSLTRRPLCAKCDTPHDGPQGLRRLCDLRTSLAVRQREGARMVEINMVLWDMFYVARW